MMFNLETLRLIRKTNRRFLSLSLIVFIGSAFLMGMLSSPLTMNESVDRYYDQNELQDLTIYSPYGFCEEDYVALKNAEGCENVSASKEIDVYSCCDGYDKYVVRVSELSRNLDKYELLEGRLPQFANECIALYGGDMSNHYDLNDELTLEYGSEDINEFLNSDHYKIVGLFRSPSYMSKMLGPSNLNNEDLDSIILVPDSHFINEYYTTMYMTLEGAKNYISNSDEYINYIADQKSEIENVASSQQSYLRNKIVAEATAQLDENEALFNQMKEEGQKQLDDAKQQLDDANLQLQVYESQLEVLSGVITSLEATIRNDAAIYGAIYNTTVKVEQDISSILNYFGLNGVNTLSSAMEYTYAQYNKAIAEFNSISSMITSGKAQYEEGLRQYEEGKATFEKEIADGEEQLKLARKKLEQLPSAHWYILDRDKMYSPLLYKNNCDQMKSISIYMPIMFYLVAALVCLTTMKRLIDEQRGQIGIYVALGYSNTQIIGKYISYALMASLCGGIPGIIIGQLLFPTVVYTTWRMLYYLPEMIFSFPIRNALISLAVFSILIAIITAYTVHKLVKDSPASLMRPVAPRKIKELLIEKIKFLWNSLSFTSKTTARNIFRYKSRFFMTIAGIAGCCGLLILGFSILDCVSDVLEVQYGKIFTYDYEVLLNSDENIDHNIEILYEDPKIDKAEKYMLYTTKLYFGDYDNTANLITVDSADAKNIFGLYETDTKTPIKMDNSGIIISEKLAKNGKIKAGDYVTMESANGIKAEVKVANICEMYAGHYIFMSDTAYENVFDEKIGNNIIAIACDDKQSLLKDCDRLEHFVSVSDFSSTKASFDNMIKALDLIMFVIILVAGSLAFVVLVNLTQVNISERVREIATLKVLGFNDHEINMYIFKEILLLSFIGCLVGIPIGILENKFILSVISMEMIMFGKHIKTSSYLYAIFITMIFTVIVLLFMRKPLRKVDMVESLKSVE